MGAVKKLIDKKVLRDLVPINALSAVHLQEISRKAVIDDVRNGAYVFKTGDRDDQTVYLLEGQIELVDARRNVVETLAAGSEAARHPLAHKQPRQLGARAVGNVTVARIDSSLLDVLLTWDESSGYDVKEIEAHEDDDWMTRMLQSQAFLQLPPSNIHQLLMRLEAVTAAAGDVIVRQGEDGDYFYIVKSGRLAVTRKASARSKEVLLAELGEGACFGEEALVSGTKRNASVMMITDGSLMRLSKQDFNELLCAPLVHEADFEGARKLVAKGAQWLDVRLPGEFENQAIKGSVNLPLSALREQCNELDQSTDYIVCCDTGRRSAAGAFVLSQRGFSVYTLKNGLMDVPDEALTRVREARAGAAVPAKDAEIIPFEADARADSGGAQDNAAIDAAAGAADTVLIDKLAAAEAEKQALSQELYELKEKLDRSEAQIGAAVRQHQDAGQEVERIRAESAALRRQLDAGTQENSALQTELEALRRDVQFNLRKFETADTEKKALEQELNRLQQTLAQIQQSADGRDDALRNELEQMAERLEKERQTHEKRGQDREAELARVREDYHQLGQRTSAVAGERDAATRDLEKARQQLADLQAELDSSRSGLQAARDQLAAAGEQAAAGDSRVGELEAELENARQASASRESELAGEIDTLRQQLEQANSQAASGRDEAADRLAALQQELEEQRRLADTAQHARDELAAQLDEDRRAAEAAGREADVQLQQLRTEHAGETAELTSLLEHMQQQLDASAEQARSLEEQLTRQRTAGKESQSELRQELDSARADLQAARDKVEELQAQLDDQRSADERAQKQSTQQLDAARTQTAELETALKQGSEQREQAEKLAAELEDQLKALKIEHEKDVASTREALSRAQMETENLKRSEAQLSEKVRKLEHGLERARHDHEAEVRRLHRELKEASGGSADALSAELEALQQKIKEDARERDDLEIKLGERSAQFESVQAEAQDLLRQLDQARESARQAEQQLVEANQAANEEMAVRMEAEEKAQQALRDELTATIAQRNQSQEQMTVQQQELEELRTALTGAQRDLRAREQALAAAEQVRDEAVQRRQEIEEEVDQLRAEAEVTRGLVDMAAPTDEALREELEQAKKNVDVAVRLRTLAEEKVVELQHEVKRLTEVGADSGVTAAPAEEPPAGHIPSLDANDPQASALLNPDYAADEVDAATAPLLLDDDEPAAVPGHGEGANESSRGGGRVRRLLGFALAACLAGGGVWWLLTGQDIGKLVESANRQLATVAPSAVSDTASAGSEAGPRVDDPPRADAPTSPPEVDATPTAVVTEARDAPVARTREAPASVPSFSKGSSRMAVNEFKTADEPALAATAELVEEPVVEEPVVEAPEPPPAPAKQQPVRTFSEALASGGRTPVMVEFQADDFLMGSGLSSPHFDERPQHRVELRRFAMSKREVTFADYARFARDTGRRMPADAGWGRGERPVINVNWHDAVAYTRWLSEQTGRRYRLPSEAEWEFVARAGSLWRFWWGKDVGENRANCFDCGSRWSGRETAPVGSFAASSFGVQDMAGNVMEWVSDCYTGDYSQASSDGSAYMPAGCDQRVVRGGSYTSPADSMRSANRESRDPGARLDDLGFRVVREY